MGRASMGRLFHCAASRLFRWSRSGMMLAMGFGVSCVGLTKMVILAVTTAGIAGIMSGTLHTAPAHALETPGQYSNQRCSTNLGRVYYFDTLGVSTRRTIIFCNGQNDMIAPEGTLTVLEENPIPVAAGALLTAINAAATTAGTTITSPCTSRYQHAFAPVNRQIWLCTNPSTNEWTNLGSGSRFTLTTGQNAFGPTVSADDQTVTSGATVTLSATITNTRQGGTLEYRWVQLSGTSVTLSDERAEEPTFTAPTVSQGTDLEFSVTVFETVGSNVFQSFDTVTVTVRPQASGPTVTLGALTRKSGTAFVEYTSAITLGAAPMDDTDFTATDFTVSGATVTDLTGSGTSWTATVRRAAGDVSTSGTISLQAKENAFDSSQASDAVTADYMFSPVSVTVEPLPENGNAASYTIKITLGAKPAFQASNGRALQSSGFIRTTLLTIGGTSFFPDVGIAFPDVNNPLVQTATITPRTDSRGEGTIEFGIAAGVFTDNQGNPNAASSPATTTVNHDTTAPTVTIADLALSAERTTYTTKITLSEEPLASGEGAFVQGDITATNATVTSFAVDSTNAKVFNVTLTPTAEGEVKLKVNAGAFTDAAGNNNTESNEVMVTYAAPTDITVTLSTAAAVINSATFDVTVTLSSAPATTGAADVLFALNDITVTNGTASNLSGTGLTRTVTITPSPTTFEGAITVLIAASKFKDTDGKANRVSNTLTVTRDTTAPTVAIADLTLSAERTTYTTKITLSEDPAASGDGAFVQGDITATNATVTSFAVDSTNAKVFDVTLTPTADGEVKLKVNASAFTDAAGNNNTESNEVTATYAAPTDITVVLSTAAAVINSATFDVTVTLGVAPAATGAADALFALNDITVTNGTASNLRGTGVTRTVTITPSPTTFEGAITVLIAADKFKDADGNANGESNTLTVTRDTTAPTVSINDLPASANSLDGIAVEFEFSEAVSGFIASDVTVVNGALEDFAGSGSTYTGNIVPDGSGDVSVSIDAGALQDLAGNDNEASDTESITFVLITLQIQSQNGSPLPERFTGTTPIPIRFLFSESVTGFNTLDITVTGGRLGAMSGSGTTYTVSITPAGDADVVIAVRNEAAEASGSRKSPAATATIALDRGPTVTLGALAPETIDGTFVYVSEITFSRAPKEGTFTAADLTVTGAAARLEGSGTSWRAILTPMDTQAGGQEITLAIAAGSFEDAQGRGNAQSNAVTIDPVPTVAIIVPERARGQDPITARFVFSEPVTGFDADDLVEGVNAEGEKTGIINAVFDSQNGFTVVSETTYTATFTPNARGDIVINIPAGAAQSTDTQPQNSVASSATISNVATLETRKRISEFMHRRATNLLSNQPDILPFIRRGGDRGHIDANFSGGYGTVDVASSYGDSYTIWIDGTGSVLKDETYVLGSLGSHVFLTPNLLFGVMAQGDYARDKDSDDSVIKGYGWLIGPYFGARVSDMDVYFDGRILYGQTDNRIRTEVSDGYFDTERWLAKFRITGEVGLGSLSLLPHIDFAYTEDHQKSFTDESGSVIRGQHVWLRDLTFGLDFDYPLSLQEGGVLALSGGVSAIWNESGGTSSSLQVIDTADKVRSRIDLGLGYHHLGGSVILLDGFYDGLGVSGYESYGGSLKYNLSF